MKIYISVDMEGISGISCPEYVSTTARMYPVGQRLMTEDTNAAIRGAFDGGAEEVVVFDMHGSGCNILVEELDERAMIVSGSPHLPRFPFLNESFDGLLCIGYHAMAGTERANLEHTMNSMKWHRYCVNGKPYGELGMDAEIAAQSGVPVLMVSGDDKVCEEGASWLPGIECAVLKQGLGRQSSVCIAPKRAHRIVYEHAKRAVERLKAGEKFFLPEVHSPANVAITYKMMPDADAANVYGTRRLDGYTVETTYGHLSDMYGGTWEETGIEQKIH